MVEVFWRLVAILITSALLMGLYFTVKEIYYGNDLSTQERILYYCLIMAMIFGGAFAIERAKR